MRGRDFARKTRLNSNVAYQCLNDLHRLYHAYYVVVTEQLGRFAKVSLADKKRSFIVYARFITFNQLIINNTQ